MLKREKRKYLTPNTKIFWYLMDEELAQTVTPGFDTGSHPQAGDDDDKVKEWNDDLGGTWDDDIQVSGSSDVWDEVW